MQITQVTVNQQTTFNHPFERFANYKPAVMLTAALEPGENAWEATKKLQALAVSLVESEKEAILRRLEEKEFEAGKPSKEEAEANGLF